MTIRVNLFPISLTREEFEEQYARRSGTTVQQLHDLKQRAVQCDCGDATCRGWRMANVEEEGETE